MLIELVSGFLSSFIDIWIFFILVDNIFIGYPWNEKLSFPLFSNSRRNPNNKLSENIFVILEL
jgi:hypothetical protein